MGSRLAALLVLGAIGCAAAPALAQQFSDLAPALGLPGAVGPAWGDHNDDGTYHPEYTLDRGQMAVFIARALAGDDQSVPTPTGEPTFPDVPEDFWSYRHIGRGSGSYKVHLTYAAQ